MSQGPMVLFLDKYHNILHPCSQDATIHNPITEVKQPQAQLILGWMIIQDSVLAAKDVIVTCGIPLWLMSYEYTRGSQCASQLVKMQGCVLSCLYDQVHIKEHMWTIGT